MKVLFCSGEAYPFSKTGGLADVAFSLPKALNQLGHDVKVITPLYQKILSRPKELSYLGQAIIQMGELVKEAEFYTTVYQGVTFIFIKKNPA